MTALRPRRSFTVAIAAVSLLLAACTSGTGTTGSGPDDLSGGTGQGAESGNEGSEEIDATAGRLEAQAEAEDAGTFGVIEPIRRDPAPGWAGERIVNGSTNDWEPAIATDPHTPWVYILHNRYGAAPACPNTCPDPALILHVSGDGGRTWRPERYLCACRHVRHQADPLIEVVPETGDVYAVWLNDHDVEFSASSDHGRTWSDPIRASGAVGWSDKPSLATSADGHDVYVSYSGPTGRDPYVASSHDAGLTWSRTKAVDGSRRFYAYGGGVTPDGRVVIASLSLTFSSTGEPRGIMQVNLLASDDAGQTWSNSVVDALELGSPCTLDGCASFFYDSGPALASDADGNLVIVYNGASEPFGPQRVYVRSSTDGGRTWSARVALSRTGEIAAFPAAMGKGNGKIRVFFADRRTGRWNIWYRRSQDLGQTWSAATRISDATSGSTYKDARGFREFYGDYGEIVITSGGRTIATWGEGRSYNGPGGVWFNRER